MFFPFFFLFCSLSKTSVEQKENIELLLDFCSTKQGLYQVHRGIPDRMCIFVKAYCIYFRTLTLIDLNIALYKKCVS